MSFVRDAVRSIQYVSHPITNTSTKKEEFEISTPLWAYGMLMYEGQSVDDPDGWDGETVVPNVGVEY